MIGLLMLGALLIYLIVAIGITRSLAGLPERRQNRWLVALISLAVFALIPTWDAILGRMYFNHLCETQAGVKVYQTIELPAEYWDERGNPRFYNQKNGNLDIPLGEYVTAKSTTKKYPFHIEKKISVLRDKETGKEVSETVWILFWGGWVVRNLGIHNTADSCGGGTDSYTEFVEKLFKPAEVGQ